MKQTQALRLGQHLTMTPALQQSIRLLQLSSLDLQEEIEQVLEQNFMLERVEERPAQEAPADTPESPEAAAETPDSNESAEAAADEIEDWRSAEPRGSGEDDEDFRQSGMHVPPSLREHLTWQLEVSPFADLERALALHLIDAINDNGYLEDWPGLSERLLTQPGVTPELLEQVLSRVQDFDPPGIAARSVAECLGLQVRQLPADTPGHATALALVKAGNSDLLTAKQPARVADALGCEVADAVSALALIQALSPHPGSAFARVDAEYVTPEVFVTKKRSGWVVSLNPEVAPKLRINPEYQALVRRADASKEQQTLKQHLQEARFFLNSLKSRYDTLLRVAQCIVDSQRGFLDYGHEAMRPLILRDVAERLGVHESTVSRATAHKYMATPRGLFELKYFFSSQVATTTGGVASATAIQAMIRRLIQAEPPESPCSDSHLADLLLAEGIKVARRTVAKYRELMGIPPSHERKPPA